MNKIRMQAWTAKRSSIFTMASSLVSGYIKSFTTWEHNPFVIILLVLTPILDIIQAFPPFSIGWIVFTVILNFITFRIVTNK